jgi:hypothetical protein
LSPLKGTWYQDAVYKPFPIFSKGRWQLWFNGRNGAEERIGVATLSGYDLGFDLDLESYLFERIGIKL